MISIAHAQEAVDPALSEPSLLTTLFPFVLIIFIFYFLIIRPQSKKFKDHQQFLTELQKGDSVALSNGILGKIDSIDRDKQIATVEIASGTVIRVRLHSVAERIDKNITKKPASSGKEVQKPAPKRKTSKAKKK